MSGRCPSPHECLPEEPERADAPEPDPEPDWAPEYRDWSPATSFVISGPTPGWPGRGRVFTREQAHKWVHRTYRVLFPIPAKFTPGRWAFRVLRPTAPGGRYTPPTGREKGNANDHQ